MILSMQFRTILKIISHYFQNQSSPLKKTKDLRIRSPRIGQNSTEVGLGATRSAIRSPPTRLAQNSAPCSGLVSESDRTRIPYTALYMGSQVVEGTRYGREMNGSEEPSWEQRE